MVFSPRPRRRRWEFRRGPHGHAAIKCYECRAQSPGETVRNEELEQRRFAMRAAARSAPELDLCIFWTPLTATRSVYRGIAKHFFQNMSTRAVPWPTCFAVEHAVHRQKPTKPPPSIALLSVVLRDIPVSRAGRWQRPTSRGDELDHVPQRQTVSRTARIVHMARKTPEVAFARSNTCALPPLGVTVLQPTKALRVHCACNSASPSTSCSYHSISSQPTNDAASGNTVSLRFDPVCAPSASVTRCLSPSSQTLAGRQTAVSTRACQPGEQKDKARSE